MSGDEIVVSILRIAGNRVRIVRGELDRFADDPQYEFTRDQKETFASATFGKSGRRS